ncbi:MAG: UvrB/UvrC motif-containing protein [Candidatus Omnitrophota bacterium]
MLCDVCAANPATVHLTEIVDEQMTELHLCEECAKNKSSEMEQQFGLADLLAGLSDLGKGTVDTKESLKIKCPNCALTYADFKKVGRLGCGECYTSFRKYLLPLLKRIHGSNKHYGKMPLVLAKPLKTKTDIEELKLKLQKAVSIEDFEEAARIRDIIKKLENSGPEYKDTP